MSALLNRRPRLHTSVPSVLSGFLLVGAIQCFVLAVSEPFANIVNWLIKRGHYDILLLPQHEDWWRLSLTNLVLCGVYTAIAIVLSYRQFRAKAVALQVK